jgi:nucleoside 2-deoxyribosyltransferase
MNMQTSTLIELGYAVAKEKKIIVIGKTDILPYLALGLSKYSSDIKILPYSELNESIFEQVEMLINEFLNKSDN